MTIQLEVERKHHEEIMLAMRANMQRIAQENAHVRSLIVDRYPATPTPAPASLSSSMPIDELRDLLLPSISESVLGDVTPALDKLSLNVTDLLGSMKKEVVQEVQKYVEVRLKTANDIWPRYEQKTAS